MLRLLRNDRYFYASGQLFLLGVTFLFNLVAAKLLGPASMGQWQTISLVSIYGMIFTLGAINGMGRDVPFYRGGGDLDEVSRSIATTRAWLAGLCGLFLAGALLAYSVLPAGTGGWLAPGLVLLCARVVNAYSTILVRSIRDFRRLGWHQLLTATIMLLAIALLMAWPDLFTLFAGMFLSLLAGVWYSHDFMVSRPRSMHTLRRILSTGFPIYVVGLLFILLTSIDRVIVLYYLGTEELGHYTLATTALAVLMMAPSLVSNVMYPRLAEEFGLNRQLSGLVPLVREVVRLNLLLTLPVAAVFLVVFYFFVIPVYLDEYLPGRAAMAIILAAALFLPVGAGFGDFFNTVGLQKVYIRNVIAGLLVNVAVGVWLVGWRDTGLPGAASGTVAGLLVFACLQIVTYRAVIRRDTVAARVQNGDPGENSVP